MDYSSMLNSGQHHVSRSLEASLAVEQSDVARRTHKLHLLGRPVCVHVCAVRAHVHACARVPPRVLTIERRVIEREVRIIVDLVVPVWTCV